MKKNARLMIIGGVLFATMLGAPIEIACHSIFHQQLSNRVIFANALETTELSMSLEKTENIINEELEISNQKEDIKDSIQEEDKIKFEAAEAKRLADIEAKRVEEEKRQAAIEKENYMKSINPYFHKDMKVKTSFYSENESTDVKGNEVLTCTGTRLFKGVIAAPDEIPLYSIFLIDNELYMVLDRGNRKYIKMLDGEESNMKVDIYVPNTTSSALMKKGVSVANCKIIRYGGKKENLNVDTSKMNEYNERLKNGEVIDLESVFN